MLIFDSHAHYDDERFNEDRYLLLSSMHNNGVERICNVGANMKGSFDSVELSKKYDFIYASVGCHPEEAKEVTEDNLKILRKLATENKKVVAIGEIGLDFHFEDSPSKEIQIYAFKKQLELAKELNKPVVIHSRDASELTLEIVKEYKPKGIVHCFSYSAEQAKEYVKMGLYVGFTGVVTFKNAKKPIEAALAAGLDHILIETDCPYLAPEPHRGTRNDSSNLKYVVSVLANAFNVTEETLIEKTYNNACKVYEIN